MNLSSPPARRFFKLRLLAALASFAGFCFCAGKAWQPLSPPVVSSVSGSSGQAAAAPANAAGAAAGQAGVTASSGVPASPSSPPASDGTGSATDSGEKPPASPTPPPLTSSVVIDAGHGGIDGGTPAGKMVEKEWTLTVALALAEELKKRGHTVDLTRTTDETLPLIERPALVNAFPRTALISIHFNADSSDASGIETCYSWPKRPEVMTQLQAAAGVSEEAQLPDEGMALAQAIQSSVHEKTGARDRGIKNRTNLALTSRCLCPAVIVECGFLSNAEEGRLIRESSYRAKLVRGIADGYENWLLNRSGGASAAATPAATPDHREPLKPEDAGVEH